MANIPLVEGIYNVIKALYPVIMFAFGLYLAELRNKKSKNINRGFFSKENTPTAYKLSRGKHQNIHF
jgi:hypothetical protein